MSNISMMRGRVALPDISFARSPPFRHMSPGTNLEFAFPYPSGWDLEFFSKGLDHFHKSFKGATALETAKSNFRPLISSARVCSVVIFFKPIPWAIASTTFNFFETLSTR